MLCLCSIPLRSLIPDVADLLSSVSHGLRDIIRCLVREKALRLRDFVGWIDTKVLI